MIDLEKLKKLARAATPGPWVTAHDTFMCDGGRDWYVKAGDEYIVSGDHADDDPDCRFVAAANPTAVLELIERLERAEQERGALQQTLASRSTCMGVGDGNGKLFVYGDYESIKAAQAMILELERLRGFEQKLAAVGTSYHGLHITTADLPRTSIPNLPFGLAVTCTRIAGWELWQKSANGSVLLASEFGENGLRLDVDGRIIVDSLSLANPTLEPTAPVKRPHTCRNRLRDEGKPYPRSGCAHCKTGGLTGCPFERGGA